MTEAGRRLVLADGRRLRVLTGGAGDNSTPPGVVVFEAGLGASAWSWAGVMRRIAPFARVVAYDRAGYGDSDAAPDAERRSRLLPSLRDDLLAVVTDAVGPAPHAPLVLVGHSWGGPIVRAAAARRVALGCPPVGVVLVDPSDEHAELYFTASVRRADAAQASLLEPFARVRLLSALARLAGRGLPGDARRAAARDAGTVGAARAAAAELRGVTAGLESLRARPLELADVPVRILSGARSTPFDRSARRRLRDAHRTSATELSDGAIVEAARSGHLVPFSEPQLVADTALALLRAVRR